ncbi:MAG: SRPBCC family protein [Actinomycetota bacterium]|nr:SRPBCC family protein [Actinomycetota bacterium]
MHSIERTVTVERPLAKVWDYLSDFRSTNDWDPGTVETVRSSGDGGVGTVYHNTSKFLGRAVEVDYTVVDLEPQRLLRLRGENKTVSLTDTITFDGDAGSTTVTYHAQFVLKGPAKLADPLMPIPLKKLGDEAEQGLRDNLNRL